MIGDDMDVIFYQFIFPFHQGFQYSQCFKFMYGVVLLCRCELLGHESSRAAILPCQSLTVHCTHARFGRVAYEPYGFFCGWLYRFNNQSLIAYLLDHVKAHLMKGAPMEWRSVLGHGQEQTSICSDIGEEIPNIVHESNESLDIIIISESAPLPDSGYLVSIDINPFVVNYMTKAVDLVSVQFALGPFEEELMLPQSFKHEAKVLFVFFYGVWVDKYII